MCYTCKYCRHRFLYNADQIGLLPLKKPENKHSLDFHLGGLEMHKHEPNCGNFFSVFICTNCLLEQDIIKFGVYLARGVPGTYAKRIGWFADKRIPKMLENVSL